MKKMKSKLSMYLTIFRAGGGRRFRIEKVDAVILAPPSPPEFAFGLSRNKLFHLFVPVVHK